MSKEYRFEELFEGEGALPRPSPGELASLLETWRRVRGLPVPMASQDLARKISDRLREEVLLEELFRGEGAQPRPQAEELHGLGALLQKADALAAPPASARVAEGVRQRLIAFRLRRRRFTPPARSSGWFEGLGQVFLESRVIRALAALLLLQALALPVVAAVLQSHLNRESERARHRFLSLEADLAPLPPLEPIQIEDVKGSAEVDPNPTSVSPAPRFEPTSLLKAENDLRLRWRALLQRQQPEVRLQRLRNSGTPWAIHQFIESQTALIAEESASLEDPLDLALALRALVLAGNSEHTGDHAEAIREGVPRLLAAWDVAPVATRVAMAGTLSKLFSGSRGAYRAEAERAVRWLADWVRAGADLSLQPTWVLAEAAQALEWAPILSSREAQLERGLLGAELNRRIAGGGKAAEEAAAALLAAFPLSPCREELLRLTLFLRTRPAESVTDEPWPLVHLAWGLFPPSGLWADFNAVLRRAALSAAPQAAKERALWLLALTVFYAAPEELGER